MIYKANQIADWFLTRLNTNAGDTISPLKLQKLIYYAQAWHLTAYKQPLFKERIEAWVHGPVIPSVYKRFKDICRDCAIDSKIELSSTEFPVQTEQLLEEIYVVYGEHSAGYLEKLTHSEAPWMNARKGLKIYEGSNVEITHAAMVEYYSQLKNEA